MLCERLAVPRFVFYGIGLICLCVVMYMLGTTMTLWTMQFALPHGSCSRYSSRRVFFFKPAL